MVVEMALSLVRGGRLSKCRFVMALARRSTLSVGNLSALDYSASVGQWLNYNRRRWVWEWARYPLSVYLFMLLRRCSIPIWVALFHIDGSPRPISLVGLYTSSVGKLCSMPVARRSALLRMRSIAVSCGYVKTPRCVAWYLDLRSCSITRVLYGGLRLRLASILAIILTSLVMWARCSLKSRIVLMCTPSIFYDLFGGRYLICVPSRNLMVFI